MRKFLLVTFVLAMLPACSRSTPAKAPTAQPAAAQKAEATPAKKVRVLDAKSIERKTELVGFLDVAGDKGHRDAAVEALRAKAATMGADAIVGVEFHEGANEPGHYSGVAVRFKKHHRGSNAAQRALDTSARTQALPAPQQPAPKK